MEEKYNGCKAKVSYSIGSIEQRRKLQFF